MINTENIRPILEILNKNLKNHKIFIHGEHFNFMDYNIKNIQN